MNTGSATPKDLLRKTIDDELELDREMEYLVEPDEAIERGTGNYATMCYMMPGTVGVRELRQNLSVYLDRVKEGETLTVTEHGHVVALLTPLPPKTMNVLERLVAEGKATAPTRSLRNLPLPGPGVPGMPPSEVIISEMREDIV